MGAHLVVWFSLAHAAPDAAAYPERAAVTLPAAGVAVAALPADVVGAGSDDLARTMSLVDATGASVPYTVVVAPRYAGDQVPGAIEPMQDGRWVVSALPLPIDGLLVSPNDSATALAEVTGPDGATTKAMVWTRPDGSVPVIPVAPSTGPFTVRLTDITSGEPVTLNGASGIPARSDVVAPIEETLPLDAPELMEGGRARWVIRLPGPREVREVRLDVDGDLFEREVWIAGLTEGIEDVTLSWGVVRRVLVGQARIDATRIFGLVIHDDTLVLEVATERGAALPIRSVTVVSTGAVLVARDVGDGPHTLLIGGPPESEASELAAGVDALLMDGFELGRVEAPAVNSGFVPVATRQGVDGPGAALDVHRWRYARALDGRGWSAVRIDGSVIARSLPSGEDLRVVDGEGRQVPFLLRTTLADGPVALGDVRREENGSVSLLHVPVREPAAPIRSLFLRSGEGTFSREVSVLVEGNGISETVRRVSWDSAVQGPVLRVDLDRVMGAELVVRIENGGDAPLEVASVQATERAWELRANLPEGARLLYGNRSAPPTAYDVTMLAEPMLRARVGTAVLGEEVENVVERTTVDRAATWAGVAVLVVGLAGMAVRVLRAPARVEDASAEG